MLFRWLDTGEVKQFAADICVEFSRLRKSVALRGDDPVKRGEKFAKLRDKAASYSAGLNFYKKACFINEVRGGLAGLDVPEPEASAFVRSLLVAPIGGR